VGLRGLTPLHLVATCGVLGVLKQINYEFYQLDKAVRRRKGCNVYTNVIELLISKGANINIMDCRRNTPLHYAVLAENLSVIKKLIDLGADITIANISQQTALSLATILKNEEIINYLSLITCIMPPKIEPEKIVDIPSHENCDCALKNCLCNKIIKACLLEDHYEICSEKIIECISGCTETFKRKELLNHLQFHCKSYTVLCIACEYKEFSRYNLNQHLLNQHIQPKNSYRPTRSNCVLSPYGCGATNITEKHIIECDINLVNCHACKEIMKRSEIVNHICFKTGAHPSANSPYKTIL